MIFEVLGLMIEKIPATNINNPKTMLKGESPDLIPTPSIRMPNVSDIKLKSILIYFISPLYSYRQV